MTRAMGLMLAAAVLAAGGCNEAHRADRHTDAHEYGRVYLLSGAGGMMGECDRIRDGLKQGGARRPIETFHWSRGGVLTDQTGVEANRRKARQLARRIEAFKRVSPGAPVHLIGVSAGTGLVVWALEDLEPGVDATAGILISSSLDTRYDLSEALANTRDGIYSFKSVADTVLSLGVTWAGTVDRNGGLAGGLVGFATPAGASEETKRLYKEKLHEIGWWPGDTVLGHLGDHLGATNPAYVKEKVAPIVLGEEPPKPPEDAPAFEAVRRADTAGGADADADEASEKTADEAPETKEPSPVEKQAEKARRDLEGQGGTGGSKAPEPSVDPEDRARFHDWRVGTGGEGRAPVDEAAFFARPERLP
ncbi:MAG: hypothetical protein R6X20_05725 [Phycisphaerae bacterium]